MCLTFGKVGIFQCGLDIGMTSKFLYRSQINAGSHQVRYERVPKIMDSHGGKSGVVKGLVERVPWVFPLATIPSVEDPTYVLMPWMIR